MSKSRKMVSGHFANRHFPDEEGFSKLEVLWNLQSGNIFSINDFVVMNNNIWYINFKILNLV